ncbi:MAG: methyltransferase domain-containing protein [Crocinitomicaceae bacterium]|nr:methyltransferase domain-containing protein [Crocinitomicaceae bacterium]|tara:strand:+ start:64972 stop:65682 length:711 start_codon:yes stop_codon:yes gene_type:complete
MSDRLNDPMGQAIIDFARTHEEENIDIISDICEDDIIPASYLFRSYDEMPKLEQFALSKCTGRTLDIGAAAGMHAEYLVEQGIDVEVIDISKNSIEHLKSKSLKAREVDFFEYDGIAYDTLLFLMNGIGIAKNIANLENTLLRAKGMLNENGKILCDSADIKYLYEDNDGGMWVDLNTTYYGNFKFQMKYKDHETDWFEWLYVDFDTLAEAAKNVGMIATKIYEEDDQYLAELKIV